MRYFFAVKKKRIWLSAVLLTVFYLQCGGRSFAMSSSGSDGAVRPNILFIMADDHAAHSVSAYGSILNETPNIDRLANEGIRFSNGFCVNSLCAPSRATLLTGKYSCRHGVMDNRTPFRGSQRTLPKLLQRAGYKTAIIGKWHLKSSPTGFDYSNILRGQGEYYDPLLVENGVQLQLQGYTTELITDLSLDWLEQQRESPSPFFLMMHHKAPHAQWQPAEKYAAMYEDKEIPVPETFFDNYESRCAQIRNNQRHLGSDFLEFHAERFGPVPEGLGGGELKSWCYQQYIKNYLRCVASVDDSVGRILDFLAETGLDQNTIVIYTSDHGMFLGEHGLFDKRLMYEESLRIPLLLRLPASMPAGSVSDELVLNLDIAPTLLDFAGVKIPRDMQGDSFKGIVCGVQSDTWRQAFYYHYYEANYGLGPHEGIRTKRYKLIHYLYGDEGWELFDLQEDPHELNNLYGRAGYAKQTDALKAQLRNLRVSAPLSRRKKNEILLGVAFLLTVFLILKIAHRERAPH